MPLFHKSSPPPPPAPASPPNRSRSLFSRNRDNHDQYQNANVNGQYDEVDHHNGSGRSGGFFSRRRSSSSSSSSEGRRGSNLRSDPSILSARQKVNDAEAFEREADRALGQARAAVREARDHVKMLEREALDE